MNFFTSDTHFGHERILTLCNRPFKSLEEMDETLIERWNAKVTNDDIVWHLGDFAWHKREAEYLKRLNGEVRLIAGNHDTELVNGQKCILDLFNRGFEWVDKEYIGVIEGLGKTWFHLYHYPIIGWDKSHHGSWHFHGHVHGKLDFISLNPRSVDVGVDSWNFEPVSFDEIKSAKPKR